MWGIRAIRVGVFLGGLLATTVGSGCCDCCQNLWKSEKAIPAGQPGVPPVAKDTEGNQPQPAADWHRPWFNDQPTHLTPEKIHGGIY